MKYLKTFTISEDYIVVVISAIEDEIESCKETIKEIKATQEYLKYGELSYVVDYYNSKIKALQQVLDDLDKQAIELCEEEGFI